jgi:hypothetical protein
MNATVYTSAGIGGRALVLINRYLLFLYVCFIYFVKTYLRAHILCTSYVLYSLHSFIFDTISLFSLILN